MDITTSWDSTASFDWMWANTIQIFGTLEIPIQTIEKVSGIIVSDWFVLAQDDAVTLDCGTYSFFTEPLLPLPKKAKITVVIREAEQDKHLITVKGQYRMGSLTCFSNGTIERTIKDGIVGQPDGIQPLSNQR